VPSPQVTRPRITDDTGTLTVDFTLPSGVPPGLALFFQAWVKDAGAIAGVASSNGLAGVTQ